MTVVYQLLNIGSGDTPAVLREARRQIKAGLTAFYRCVMENISDPAVKQKALDRLEAIRKDLEVSFGKMTIELTRKLDIPADLPVIIANEIETFLNKLKVITSINDLTYNFTENIEKIKDACAKIVESGTDPVKFDEQIQRVSLYLFSTKSVIESYVKEETARRTLLDDIDILRAKYQNLHRKYSGSTANVGEHRSS